MGMGIDQAGKKDGISMANNAPFMLLYQSGPRTNGLDSLPLHNHGPIRKRGTGNRQDPTGSVDGGFLGWHG